MNKVWVWAIQNVVRWRPHLTLLLPKPKNHIKTHSKIFLAHIILTTIRRKHIRKIYSFLYNIAFLPPTTTYKCLTISEYQNMVYLMKSVSCWSWIIVYFACNLFQINLILGDGWVKIIYSKYIVKFGDEGQKNLFLKIYQTAEMQGRV